MSDDQLCGLAVVLDGSEHEVAAAHWAANWAEHSHHHLSLIEPSELVSAQTSSQRHRTRCLADELRCTHPGLTVDHRILDGGPDAVICRVSPRCTAMAVSRPSGYRHQAAPRLAVPQCPLVVVTDEPADTQTISLLVDPRQTSYAPTAFAFAYAASCGSDLQALLIGADSEHSPGEDAIRQLAICYPSVTLRTSVLPSWGGVADEVAGSQLVVVGSWTDRQGRHRIDHGFLVAQAMADVDSPVALITHEPAA
jgi:hypothetical protein